MPRFNRTTVQGQDVQLLEGIMRELDPTLGVYLAGKSYTRDALAALVQRRIDAANRVRVLRAEWLAAGREYDAIDAEVRRALHDFKPYVLARFGAADEEKLAAFGYAPPKVPARTPEQKAAIVAKARATRAARHTLGPKARLAITGETPEPKT